MASPVLRDSSNSKDVEDESLFDDCSSKPKTPLCVIVQGNFILVNKWIYGMALMISGTIINNMDAWSVVWVEWAHTTIYVGSVFVMLAALMLVIFGWDQLMREHLAVDRGCFPRPALPISAGWQYTKLRV